jgi:hypothetical protein
MRMTRDMRGTSSWLGNWRPSWEWPRIVRGRKGRSWKPITSCLGMHDRSVTHVSKPTSVHIHSWRRIPCSSALQSPQRQILLFYSESPHCDRLDAAISTDFWNLLSLQDGCG